MITEDNQSNPAPQDENANATNQVNTNVNPDDRKDNNKSQNWENTSHQRLDTDKANVQNERRNLIADQEKRPSEHNPEHGNLTRK
jgi:hypothetical protein